MTCVSDWMRLNCGDHVCRKNDPAHVGRVDAISHGAFVIVRWDRAVEVLPLGDIERADRAQRRHDAEVEAIISAYSNRR